MIDETEEASHQQPDCGAPLHDDLDNGDDGTDEAVETPETTITARWQRVARSPVFLGLVTLAVGTAAISLVRPTLLTPHDATVPLLSAPVDATPDDLDQQADPDGGDDPLSPTTTIGTADGSTTDGPEPVPGPGPPTTWQTEASAGGSTTPTTAPPSPPSTDDPAVVSARVQRFRSLASDIDVTSEAVTDDDIARFGRTLCTVAEVIDGGDYTGFRAEVIDDYDDLDDNRLSTEELGQAVDAAIEAFCPGQADRLGLA